MSVRYFVVLVAMVFIAYSEATGGQPMAAPHVPENGKELGTICNNDGNNILLATSGADVTVEEYRYILEVLLDAGPGVLAQNVGAPDPVIYRSRVATTEGTYSQGHDSDAISRLVALGTDPLAITVETCRQQGVLIVASYRMNAEDARDRQLESYDFGRRHKDWAIPGRNCLDPAIPEVYQHRMAIFREVVENYDIDGLELDFRRWSFMISQPLKNHPILTRMVRETRAMLDEAARKKGRNKLLLGVRVGPMLEGVFRKQDFPGAVYSPPAPANRSCKDLGLDVRTWIDEGLVDYVCPTLFWPSWPGLPHTAEFVALAQDTQVGIYPTLWPVPAWLRKGPDQEAPIAPNDRQRMRRYKDEFCQLATSIYEDGADGISTFNWYFHVNLADAPNRWNSPYGKGGSIIQRQLLSVMGDPIKLRQYRDAPWRVPRTESEDP